MRRTIQDLVASVDPNVKIEPEVEDVSVPDYTNLIFDFFFSEVFFFFIYPGVPCIFFYFSCCCRLRMSLSIR